MNRLDDIDAVLFDIGGTLVSVQIGMNLTIVGSKELPQDTEQETGALVGHEVG